jgi:hypothetical protein
MYVYVCVIMLSIATRVLLTLLLLLLLLTAIGLSPGDSSPTLVQTKRKIHKTTITTK